MVMVLLKKENKENQSLWELKGLWQLVEIKSMKFEFHNISNIFYQWIQTWQI